MCKSKEKNDPLRFQNFLEKLIKRKSKVNVGALQPHQLMQKALQPASALERVLVQAQWQALLAQAMVDAKTKKQKWLPWCLGSTDAISYGAKHGKTWGNN